MNTVRQALRRRPSLPTAISLLALAVATTGTAAAATGQLVNIVDGTAAGNVARVTQTGELKVNGRVAPVPPATPLLSSNFYFLGTTGVFGPTKATIALDHLAIRSPVANQQHANTDMRVYVVRLPVSNGACESGGLPAALAAYGVRAGQTTVVDYSTPLQIKPVDGAAYCVGLDIRGEPGTPTTYALPQVTVKGSVVTGSYTGPGTTTVGAPAGRDPVQRAGQPAPRGVPLPLD